VPLLVVNPAAIRVIDDVMRGNRLLVFTAQREARPDAPVAPENVHRVGTAGAIHQMARMPDGKAFEFRPPAGTVVRKGDPVAIDMQFGGPAPSALRAIGDALPESNRYAFSAMSDTAAALAEHAHVLMNGQVALSVPAADLLRNPDVLRSYLGR